MTSPARQACPLSLPPKTTGLTVSRPASRSLRCNRHAPRRKAFPEHGGSREAVLPRPGLPDASGQRDCTRTIRRPPSRGFVIGACASSVPPPAQSRGGGRIPPATCPALTSRAPAPPGQARRPRALRCASMGLPQLDPRGLPTGTVPKSPPPASSRRPHRFQPLETHRAPASPFPSPALIPPPPRPRPGWRRASW